ncbi:MAG: hypothetical protein HQL88_04465 [Magnetococcales bacterium]|nr:hypothetical protein [Magnetococcales bacterium]
MLLRGLVLLSLIGLLAGCGHKGALYLPGPPAAKSGQGAPPSPTTGE